MAIREHMRLDTPEHLNSVAELVSSRRSLVRPADWKALLEIGPMM